MAEESERLRELVAQVASAFFSNSHVSPNDIPVVLSHIATGLAAVGSAPAAEAIEPEKSQEVSKPTPAQIRRSITPDALISFEDNRPYKALRRHLAGRGLTAEAYREKWGLPADYPMVAASYSARRSELAKSVGLGQRGRSPRGRRPRS